ncbi:hypothetical protein [Carnobacterium pleistocenium]|uniref:hypothetical protein n=1 Tax=Carnobacterium pleistocenium TaxID=181073 RepID=UPI000A6B9BAB|nr:hypothetical protein [Carnobacterium pleistocenium]
MSLEKDLNNFRAIREKQIGALEQQCFGISAALDKKLKVLSRKIDRATIKEEVVCWRA